MHRAPPAGRWPSLALLGSVSLLLLAAGCDAPGAGPASSASAPSAQPAAPSVPVPALDPTGPGTVHSVGDVHCTIAFTGQAPKMRVPAKRKKDPACSAKEIAHNAVVVTDGKLEGTLVRLELGGLRGYLPGQPKASEPFKFKPKQKVVKVTETDCTFTPRVLAALVSQTLEIHNDDSAAHKIRGYAPDGSMWFAEAQEKGAAPIVKPLEQPGFLKLTCDDHPWMRTFVAVSDTPFYAVSGADGTATIRQFPVGSYMLESWHPRYGSKKQRITVDKDKTTEVTFTYDGTEPETDVDKGELDGMF